MSNTVLSYRNYIFERSATPTNNIETPQRSDLYIETAESSFEVVEGETTYFSAFGYQTNLYEIRKVGVAGSSGGSGDPIAWQVQRDVQVIGLTNVRLLEHPGTEFFADYPIRARLTLRDLETNILFQSDWIDVLPVISTEDQERDLPSAWVVLDAPISGVEVVEWSVRVGADSAGQSITIGIGAWWVGPGFTTSGGLEEGWAIRTIDPGTMALSDGIQGHPSVKSRTKELTAFWAPVPFDVAYGNPATPAVMDMQAIHDLVGNTGYCVFFPRTKDASGNSSSHIQRRLGIYGHFNSLGDITDQGGNNFKWGPFTFRELL